MSETPSSAALLLYDVEIDAFRPPRQADLDTYMALIRAYGRIRHAISERGTDEHLREVITRAHTEFRLDIGLDQKADGPLPEDSILQPRFGGSEGR